MSPSRPWRYRHAQAGFSLIEVMTVMAVVGIVVNIAIPAWSYAIDRARAVSVVTDFRAIHQAAQQHYRDLGSYPEDGAAGEKPADLDEYLQGAIRWVHSGPDYTYDWEYWVKENGEPEKPASGVLVGLSVHTGDAEILARISAVYDGPFLMTGPERGTFVIEPIP